MICIHEAQVSSFEPTYQGLKPSYTLIMVSSFLGFEPTYQGLKLVQPGVANTGLVRFEPTYQGLKRGAALGRSPWPTGF